MSEQKTPGQLLADELLLKPKNSGELLEENRLAEADRFCEEYKRFLDRCKTEREVVDYLLEELPRRGYEPFEAGRAYLPGQKVYYNNRGKAMILATIGTQPLDEGVRIMASHIDNPRLDLKPRPLYEESELGFFKTHYYGGIKKYQWTAIPLALHGVVAKKDGTVVKVSLGEDPRDPVFTVTDLLPHLSGEQMRRSLADGVRGEELNILIGSRPFKDDKVSERVKLQLAKLLRDRYAITEADFLSAELCAVPAFSARDLGLDRSMIGAYGHDDRVCAYTSLMAALEVTDPVHTTVTVLADKEETGSEGNTGLQSSFLRYFISDLAEAAGYTGREVLSRSVCLSADVNAAWDPTFSDPYERRNSAYLNYGVCLTKYTGARGKSDTNDASAELMARMRSLMDNAGVQWQTGELGKVDGGGGGTVAKYVADLDVDTVDIGVPVLSMHAPFEVVSKTDVYMTYLAFRAFARD
ncbi:MAG TPA: aminopeptidase [Firmicutes bacterium]|nr:aminopeptidase [Bacillota bacterium]